MSTPGVAGALAFGAVGHAGPGTAGGSGRGQRPERDRAQGLADEHPPLCAADSAGGNRRLRGDGQGPADPGAAAVPGCGRAAPGSPGSCWRPATGCSARPSRVTHRFTARSWAPPIRTARCSGPSRRRWSSAPVTWSSWPTAVYLIDLTVRRALSVRELANVFAAFRWGGLLQVHAISAMEFPYSVAGLTAQHLKMRWPDISRPARAGQTRHAAPHALRRGPGCAEPRLPGRALDTRLWLTSSDGTAGAGCPRAGHARFAR